MVLLSLGSFRAFLGAPSSPRALVQHGREQSEKKMACLAKLRFQPPGPAFPELSVLDSSPVVKCMDYGVLQAGVQILELTPTFSVTLGPGSKHCTDSRR